MSESQQIQTRQQHLVRLHAPKENFGLTKIEFDKYVSNLKTGDDSFIIDILSKQLPESMCYLQKKFQITHEKSYDVCLDTFLVFREKLLKGKIYYGNLKFLFTRMCVNQYIDEQKNKNKVNKSIQEFLEINNQKKICQESFFNKLDKVITKLKPDQQSLIKEIYYSGKSMQLISDETGINYPSLRKKKERILKKIRTYFTEQHYAEI